MKYEYYIAEKSVSNKQSQASIEDLLETQQVHMTKEFYYTTH